MIKEQCPAHVVHKDPASRSLLVGHGQTPELRNFHSLFFSNGEPARFQQLSFVLSHQEQDVDIQEYKPKLTLLTYCQCNTVVLI